MVSVYNDTDNDIVLNMGEQDFHLQSKSSSRLAKGTYLIKDCPDDGFVVNGIQYGKGDSIQIQSAITILPVQHEVKHKVSNQSDSSISIRKDELTVTIPIGQNLDVVEGIYMITDCSEQGIKINSDAYHKNDYIQVRSDVIILPNQEQTTCEVYNYLYNEKVVLSNGITIEPGTMVELQKGTYVITSCQERGITIDDEEYKQGD